MKSLEALIDEVLSEMLPDTPDGGIDVFPQRKIVRDAVWGMVELLPHEVLIVNTPLFQRLRGIFQTGLTYLVYPCAIHSRFEHSLGCLHLADRYCDALERRMKIDHNEREYGPSLSPSMRLTVRLAALLHDVSHCIFSHVSENIYKHDSRIGEASEKIKADSPVAEKRADIGAAEALAYLIIGSTRFKKFFENLRKNVDQQVLPSDVKLENVARLIVGLPPAEYKDHAFLTQIINGPFDVDKVDYQTRDGYFTGVAMPVDKERLLASLCVVQEKKGDPYELAVDHRGIAPVEQLLFNRMLLYDSVYHHHKIRAAVQLFERHVASSETLGLEWLLRHDEYDFFGMRNTPDLLKNLVVRLRFRDLPHRAVIVHRGTINHPDDEEESVWFEMMQKLFSKRDRDRDDARNWFDKVKKKIPTYLESSLHDKFYLDLPEPPKYMKVQQGSKIKFSDGHVATLDDVFPITTAINSYAQQCKYRVYVFADSEGMTNRVAVAAATYKAFRDEGIELNEDAFRLAKLDPKDVRKVVGENGAIPKRRPVTGIA